MATTKRNDAKNQIMDILNKQGYPSYARLLNLFDIYLTDDPEVIGYMIPGKAKIVLNKELNIDQVSTIVRHEILHEYLVHAKRQEELEKSHPDLGSDHQLANIAGDFEISNRGYTDADKSIARSIALGDKVLKGLVTEDQFPGWEKMTFEEMYEKLLEKQKQEKDSLKDLLDKLQKISKKDLDDLQKDIDSSSGEGSISDEQQSKGASNTDKNSDESSNEDQKGSSGSSKETSDKKNDESSTGSETGTDNDSENSEKDLKKLSGAIQDVKKELDKLSQNQTDGTPLDTPAEQKEKEELAKRVARIKKAFEDEKQKQDIINDNTAAIRKEKASKEARNIDRVRRSGISKFKLSLNHFIANQVEEEDVDTYARENPTYADEGEFILPGRIRREEKHIPIINVYWDISGSFQDPKKTEGARSAIATLNQYVRNGDIEIHVYYFADRVSDTPRSAGGGTNARPVVDHIIQTKPDNVIIVTDSDTTNQTIPSVQVPGAVWMLFYDGRSLALMDHVKGKKENKYFDIEY